MEASRGAAARSVTVKPIGCGFDPHARRCMTIIFILLVLKKSPTPSTYLL